MSFVPMEPIQSLAGQAIDLGGKNLVTWGEEKSTEHSQMPFASYFEQAFNGVNNSLLDAAISGARAASGQVTDLNKVTLSAAEAEVMYKLAVGVASKLTSSASTLFQMQF